MSTEHEEFGLEKTLAKIIGLTGGIASGKSTVSSIFHSLGVKIIDADLISRDVVRPGSPALLEIAESFGKQMIQADGELNRELLGKTIFENAEARSTLNAIVHPHVASEFLRQVQVHSAQGVKWLIYDAALIVENNLQSAFDGLIVVSCHAEIQKKRLMERNSLSEKEAMDRIESQFPLSKKVEVGDWIIDNSGSLDKSTQQVHQLFEELCSKFGIPTTSENDD